MPLSALIEPSTNDVTIGESTEYLHKIPYQDRTVWIIRRRADFEDHEETGAFLGLASHLNTEDRYATTSVSIVKRLRLLDTTESELYVR